MPNAYRIRIASAADRVFRKLPRRMREEIEREIRTLSTNPYAGERLAGSLNFLYSYHFAVFGKYFRAAYTVDAAQRIVTLHYVGPRGEFYKRLRRLFQK